MPTKHISLQSSIDELKGYFQNHLLHVLALVRLKYTLCFQVSNMLKLLISCRVLPYICGMAESGVKQPLLPGLLNFIRKNNQENGYRRRCRKCKSAPVAEFVPGQLNGKDGLPPQSESIINKLHPNT